MKRVYYFDLLNVFACFSVVALHCNGFVHSFAHNSSWLQALLVEVVLFSAVPIFFMLSGATLLNFRARYSVGEFYKKRFSKTLIPYLFFGILLSALLVFRTYLKTGSLQFNVHDFISSLLTGNIPYANYWFFIPLFMYYLFLPALERIASNSKVKEILSLIGLLFIFKTATPILNYAFDLNITGATPIYGYCFFAFIGYALAKSEFEKNKKLMIVLGVLTVASWACRYYGIYGLHARDSFWFDYFAFYSVIPATFIFLVAKSLNGYLENKQALTHKLKVVSSLSFGVYLIHGLVLSFLPFGHGTFVYRIVCLPFVYAFCCLAVFAIKKVKSLNWMIP